MADEHLRKVERQAAQGDAEAIARLERERIRVGDTHQTATGDVSFTLVIAHTQQEYEIELPADASVEQILPALIPKLGLARGRYALAEASDGRPFGLNETLTSAGGGEVHLITGEDAETSVDCDAGPKRWVYWLSQAASALVIVCCTGWLLERFVLGPGLFTELAGWILLGVGSWFVVTTRPNRQEPAN